MTERSTPPPRRTMPRPVRKASDWDLPKLREHLQFAVDLELWTIPYYMSAMFSVKDPASEAMRLIRTVVNQEMLHMQLAANVANAYGADVCVTPPEYGKGIPHICFKLDKPNPTNIFGQPDSNLGPLDCDRINTMCLIEYPSPAHAIDTNPDDDCYGSIGEFYAAMGYGAERLKHEIIGNRNQLDLFSRFYPDFGDATVTRDGEYGWPQVWKLIVAIVDQGEGKPPAGDTAGMTAKALASPRDAYVFPSFQNQADDLRKQADHFDKFTYIRSQPLPERYQEAPKPTDAGRRAQERLVKRFTTLCSILEDSFRGKPHEFGPLMFQIGGDVVTCWQNGAVPTFSGSA